MSEKNIKIRSSSTQKKKQTELHLDQNKEEQERNSRSSNSNPQRQTIVLGICAMQKKIKSKPMKEILTRLKCPEISILQMWEYLDSPYQQWPKVDALICFHSDGFPFLQAWRYVKKHKPFLINNLQKQQLLWDRTVVYDILKKIRVPVAKHYMIFKDYLYLDQIQMRGMGNLMGEQYQLQDKDLNLIKRKTTVSDERKSGTVTPPSVTQENTQPPIIKEQTQKFISNQQLNHSQSVAVMQRTSNQNSMTNSRRQNNKLRHSMSMVHDQLLVQNFQESLSRKSNNQNDIQKKSTTKQSNTFKKGRNSQKMTKQSNRYPNTLRKFHQERIKNNTIQDYEVQEIQDYLLIKSKNTDKTTKLKKPFVQKPFDAENHNICIYYPESMGGGRKMLFRKIKNVSSQYQPNQNHIRRDANYIYEQFLPTNAFDIKVYTIGPYYMYAQARRSPTLDGVVERDQKGKEKRFPVILTPQEKFVCQKIVQQFGQQVCGFDLLRAGGKSYVCDVNGWSFVKGNPKYWDDCAIILRRKIYKKFFPHLTNPEYAKYERFSNNTLNQYRPSNDKLASKHEQLRSIVSIFRHGDRSPKLKLKLKTKDPRFLKFFQGTKKDQLKLKDAKSLTKILDITNQIIVQINDITKSQFKDYSQMKSVLQTGGRFQGFNRKLQMKVQERQTQPNEKGQFPVSKIMIVLKWGGQLSYIGYQDALDMGQKMRVQRYDDDHDFLSLYSSYKHDLKTYSSDQGRCIKTAAAFLKGFLNISGGLAPIITSMVNFTKKAQTLLDCTSVQNHSPLSDQLKRELSQMLNSQDQLSDSYMKKVSKQQICQQMLRIINVIGKPRQKIFKIHQEIGKLVMILQDLQLQNWNNAHSSTQSQVQSHQETDPQALIIIYKRWSKLQKDLYDKQTKLFNISKIPQIYDNIRYDLKKNLPIFSKLDKEEFNVQQFYDLARLLAHFVVPNQYGMNDKEKLATAKDIVSPLLQKVLVDLLFWKNKKFQDLYWKYKEATTQDDWKHIRTRLYFTSASHMYSIFNMITLGDNRLLLKNTPQEDAKKAINQLYMSYLSHIQFRLYEDMRLQQNNPNRFRIQLSISSMYKKDRKMQEFRLGDAHGFTIDKIQKLFQSFLSQKQEQMQTKVNQMIDETFF